MTSAYISLSKPFVSIFIDKVLDTYLPTRATIINLALEYTLSNSIIIYSSLKIAD